MPHTRATLGMLALMAGLLQPPLHAATASSEFPVVAEGADRIAPESFEIPARPAVSYSELTTRLNTANQQLQQEELLVRKALSAAQQAAREAAMARDSATSNDDRDRAAAKLKQANDVAAQLTAQLQNVTQRKLQLNDLLSRASGPRLRMDVRPVAPKELSDSVAQLEDASRQSALETQRVAQLALSLPQHAEAPPTSTPPPPPPTTFASPGGGQDGNLSSLADRVDKWFGQLKQGALQYKVPSTMFWKESSTVTVVIQGPAAQKDSALPDATGHAPVKVSDRMRVVLTSPDNPDEFTINREQGTDEIQFVPDRGSTTWNWSVTPKYTGRRQKLSIAASVLYPGQDDKILLELPVYTADIDVHVPGFGDSLKRLIEGDPDYWLRYGLPGGGGFIFVAGALAGLRKWARRRKRGHNNKTLPTAAG